MIYFIILLLFHLLTQNIHIKNINMYEVIFVHIHEISILKLCGNITYKSRNNIQGIPEMFGQTLPVYSTKCTSKILYNLY